MKEGWVVKTLGDIAEVKGGKRVPKGYSLQTTVTAHPYLTVSDFTDEGSINTSKIRYISNDVFEAIKRYTISSKDIFISIAGTIGKTGFIPPELEGANLTENACKLVLNTGIDRDYLFYYTKTDDFSAQAGTHTRTAAQPKLALERLKSIKLPVAPLPEQQRIVAILDEAFESIAIAKANAEKNLQNAKALFESYLQGVFSQRGDGWKKGRLVDFTVTVSTGPFGSLLHKSDYVSDGVPLVNPINIIDNYIVPNESKQISDATKARLQSYILQESDIVIARRGEIGRCAVVTVKEAGWICGTGCFFIRPLPTTDSRFLANLIRSVDYRKKLEEVSSGATMLNLSNKSLCDLEVIMPSFEEQKSILQKLDLLSEETQRLESLYQQKITALDELKKALLHQAFSGQL